MIVLSYLFPITLKNTIIKAKLGFIIFTNKALNNGEPNKGNEYKEILN